MRHDQVEAFPRIQEADANVRLVTVVITTLILPVYSTPMRNMQSLAVIPRIRVETRWRLGRLG